MKNEDGKKYIHFKAADESHHSHGKQCFKYLREAIWKLKKSKLGRHS